MVNKKGFAWGAFIPLALLVILVAVALFGSGEYSIFNAQAFSDAMSQPSMSLTDAFGQSPSSPLRFLDYIFGKVPAALTDITSSDISAGIVMVAIWIMFFLIFTDIFSLFGMFTRPVTILISLLLVIIGANVKLLAAITVYALTVLAVFGSFSVLFALAFVFALFIAFHFGTSELRRKIILRRAEDQGLRAVAGGKKAASGIEVLKGITEASGKGEK